MIQKKRSTPTVKDVAREAGVAIGTVSRVINGKPVTEEYQKKVMEAIKKLDYHVNSYAQGLKATRTYTVAMLIPNTENPFFGKLVNAVQHSLSNRGYRLLLCCTDSNQREEQEYVDMARMNKVDGIIGITYNPNLNVSEDTPFVSIDRVLGHGIPCVTSDNFAGGEMAAEELHARGCRNVIFLRVGSSTSGEPDKRRSGFEFGCAQRGLPCNSFIQGDGDDLNEVFAAFLKEHIHDGRLDYDGIFCVTDLLAVTVAQILKSFGIVAGRDVQLIGFDGIQQFGLGDYVCSTIVQPVEAIAETSVDLLLGDKASAIAPLVCLPVHFTEGGTTGPRC